MPPTGRSRRVLIYSHDSYGLGHVSRCRTIANAIVAADSSVSVLIISGSPVIGSYEFRSGIDFVRIPGVIKQIETGEYDSANLRLGVEHTMDIRTRIIREQSEEVEFFRGQGDLVALDAHASRAAVDLEPIETLDAFALLIGRRDCAS